MITDTMEITTRNVTMNTPATGYIMQLKSSHKPLAARIIASSLLSNSEFTCVAVPLDEVEM